MLSGRNCEEMCDECDRLSNPAVAHIANVTTTKIRKPGSMPTELNLQEVTEPHAQQQLEEAECNHVPVAATRPTIPRRNNPYRVPSHCMEHVTIGGGEQDNTWYLLATRLITNTY